MSGSGGRDRGTRIDFTGGHARERGAHLPDALRDYVKVIALLLVPIAVAVPRAAALAEPAGIRGGTVIVPGGSYTNVAPSTLTEMLVRKNIFLLNVHVPYEGEIEGTDANVPYDQVEQRMSQLPSDRGAPLVVYCRSGRMSTVAAETLVRLGYTAVWHLEGGFIGWERAGFPLIRR
jgi:rhodanese-related sulfurtransferase